LERAHDATETIAARFANRLSADLDRGRMEGRYDRLILVAPPDLLGRLRSSLSPPTESMVAGALPKDFHLSESDEIRGRLEEAALV
jgi:protein required for attachment to host cells